MRSIHTLTTTPWMVGLFVVSGAAGAVVSFLAYLLLVRITKSEVKSVSSREFWYSGVLTGVIERAFFTSLIGLLGPTGIAPAAITRIAIKGQIHYQMFTAERNSAEIGKAYLGILCSLISLFFAVFGGYVWHKGLTLDALMTRLF